MACPGKGRHARYTIDSKSLWGRRVTDIQVLLVRPVAFVVPRAHAAELRRELTEEWNRRIANDDVLLARLASRRSGSHFVAREPQLCWEHEPEKEEWARKRRERQREQARKRALGVPVVS